MLHMHMCFAHNESVLLPWKCLTTYLMTAPALLRVACTEGTSCRRCLSTQSHGNQRLHNLITILPQCTCGASVSSILWIIINEISYNYLHRLVFRQLLIDMESNTFLMTTVRFIIAQQMATSSARWGMNKTWYPRRLPQITTSIKVLQSAHFNLNGFKIGQLF